MAAWSKGVEVSRSSNASANLPLLIFTTTLLPSFRARAYFESILIYGECTGFGRDRLRLHLSNAGHHLAAVNL